MDCNWCAVCSRHFHSDHQTSLYCSEECRKADALACCVFHDCNRPDGSTQHDHLTFCHHHRPAIRIPYLPLATLNSNISTGQQAYEQHRSEEWTRFPHAAHTSTLLSTGHDQNNAYSAVQQYSAQVSEQRRPLPSGRPQGTCPQREVPQQQWQHEPNDPVYQRCSPIAPAPRRDDASLSSALDNLSLSKHYAVSLIAQCNLDDCEQPCTVRRNKTLPPPTLSPILPPTISNPASLGQTTPTSSSPSAGNKNSILDLTLSSTSSTNAVGNGDDGESQDRITNTWPRMDKFFFPDHCCRTSPCRTPARQDKTSNSKGGSVNKNFKDSKSNRTKNKKTFASELPPPLPSPTSQQDSNGCIALSDSIWGTGWRQVEPLPESFVKTIQKSNLLWAGCEKEHQSYHGRHHQQRKRRDNCQGQGANQGRHSKASGKNASSDASSPSWATACSSRLPRSLQFID